MRKLLILLVMTLLLVGTNVWGQESWVLWAKRETIRFSGITNLKHTWEIISAHPNYNRCIYAGREICEARLDAIKLLIKDGGAECLHWRDGSMLMYDEEGKYSVNEIYQCLPGTLDPRGR